MYAVERLGSYITRGVYTVSGSFHPFGGAVDIIVVEQPDGSFKSSPWYVRFGKFQGVLKAREKVVTINVNGIKANFHMFLDQRGEAYFLREIEGEEGESVSYASYSSDEMEDQFKKSRRPLKSKSLDYDGSKSNSAIHFDESNAKIVSMTNSHQSRISGFVFRQRSMEDDSYLKEDNDAGLVRISSLECEEIAADLVETFMLDQSDLEEKLVEISEISRKIDEPSLRNAEDVTPEVTSSDSKIADMVEAHPVKKLDEKQASGFGISEEENGPCRVQSFIYCETSENSITGSVSLNEQSKETLDLAPGGPGDVHFCNENLCITAEPLHEDPANHQAEDLGLEGKHIGSCDVCPHQTNPSSSSKHGNDKANLELPVPVKTSYTDMVCVGPTIDLAEDKSKGISSISGFSNSVDQTEDKVHIGKKITTNKSLESVGDSEQLRTEAASISVSESSEEEQFFFSDADDFEVKENQGKSNFPDSVHEENFVQMNGLHNFENLAENSKVISSPIHITRRHTDPGAEVARLAGSLPNLWSDIDNLGTEDLHHPLSHSLELNSKSLEWKLLGKNETHYTNSDTANENQSAQRYSDNEDTQVLEDIKDSVDIPAVEVSLCKHLLYEGMGAEGASQAFDAEKLDIDKFTSLGPKIVKNGDPSKAIVTASGSWRLWPFPFRRSRSRKTMQPALNDTRSSDAENASNSNVGTENNKNEGKVMKKMVKAVTPTSEELASLNLKEGSNTVTFTFSTAMLGKQKVDARIYLWKWNTRIVISDVDGTITKSDVLGQFMPLVGIDWSQNGVAHLFSAIKDNGYQFLYLSARAIAQAYITRQFLVNLKQDGKALPNGPVVISPDGVFPSLFREVIRRAPHEFKIACLEDIKALFPSDCNPFYAGFGNRDTDEISYLKVGIPKGKIFIINPKGEVAVNRLVDTRSYTSLHALVHGMFPAMTSSEQEDFNSWNYWKLPPPDIDM